jgi:hypothetical protein
VCSSDLWALFLDELHGEWIGNEKYWDLYEAMNCRLRRGSPLADKLSQKDIYFTHYI